MSGAPTVVSKSTQLSAQHEMAEPGLGTQLLPGLGCHKQITSMPKQESDQDWPEKASQPLGTPCSGNLGGIRHPCQLPSTKAGLIISDLTRQRGKTNILPAWDCLTCGLILFLDDCRHDLWHLHVASWVDKERTTRSQTASRLVTKGL